MLEPLLFPLLLAVAFRLRRLAPLFALGFWANLLWFVYQNEWGSGWLTYLRGLGAVSYTHLTLPTILLV